MKGHRGAHEEIGRADAWAAENALLLAACFEGFSINGQWPTIEGLEHQFEIAGQDIEVARLAFEMPRLLGHVEQWRLILFCRALLVVEAAKPLLEAWFQAVQLAYKLWCEDPDSELISHEVVALFGGDEVQARRVSTLLLRESWMLGSGQGTEDGYWTREIVSTVKAARGARNAAELLENRARQLSPSHGAIPPTQKLNEPITDGGPDGDSHEDPERRRAGTVRRIWHYVTNNNFLAGLGVVGTLAALGYGAAVVKSALEPADEQTLPPNGAIAEKAAENGARTFHTAGVMAQEGPRIPPNRWVKVACKTYAPQPPSVLPEGYWYKIVSPPWNSRYFAPANSFWNDDVPGNTPYTHYVDPDVTNCR